MIGIERDKRFIYEMIFQFYKVRNENQVSNIVRRIDRAIKKLRKVAFGVDERLCVAKGGVKSCQYLFQI